MSGNVLECVKGPQKNSIVLYYGGEIRQRVECEMKRKRRGEEKKMSFLLKAHNGASVVQNCE